MKKQTDDEIVKEAHARFQRSLEDDRENRELFIADLKFANADSHNMFQWDSDLLAQRKGRPCLTINKTKQHNRQITGESRQNKTSIRVSPYGDGADKETAEIFNGVIRNIEMQSNADTAYQTALGYAVDGSFGYYRVVTDYIDENSRDQDIFIKNIKNPLSVVLGPTNEPDGSDCPYGFVFEDIHVDDYEDKTGYKLKDAYNDGFDTEWATDDTVRVAEYFRAVKTNDTLYFFPGGETALKSEIGELPPGIEKLPSRKITKTKIEWYFIAGCKIAEKRDWLGKYIPIIRVVGDEVCIDGKTVYTSHTRQNKDPARIYNYWSSSAVEFVALQGKQPYVGALEAFEGIPSWGKLNTENSPFLAYNHRDSTGEPIPAPQRQQPPVMAQAYITGMQIASDEMKAASGQYDATFGQNANQQSGRALDRLQQKGDVATFHFLDNASRARLFLGKILIDLIPKIYDTARIVRIIKDDDSQDDAMIDPEQEGAVKKVENEAGEIKRIYNLNVGRYDVTASIGQTYGTKRQQGFEAMTQIASGNPALMQVIGDLMFKSADFPYADEMAERLEKTVPPDLKKADDSKPQLPPEAQQKMQQDAMQLQQMQQMIQDLDQTIQKMQSVIEDKSLEKDKALAEHQLSAKKLEIDAFNAETNRLKVTMEKEDDDEKPLPRKGYKLQIDEETGDVREVKDSKNG